MRKFLMPLMAAVFAATTFSALAEDPVKAGGATEKPGRAVDEAKTVKSGGSADKPGRAVDEAGAKPKKHGKKKMKKEAAPAPAAESK